MLERVVDEHFELFLVRQLVEASLAYLLGTQLLFVLVLDLPEPLVDLVFLHA